MEPSTTSTTTTTTTTTTSSPPSFLSKWSGDCVAYLQQFERVRNVVQGRDWSSYQSSSSSSSSSSSTSYNTPEEAWPLLFQPRWLALHQDAQRLLHVLSSSPSSSSPSSSSKQTSSSSPAPRDSLLERYVRELAPLDRLVAVTLQVRSRCAACPLCCSAAPQQQQQLQQRRQHIIIIIVIIVIIILFLEIVECDRRRPRRHARGTQPPPQDNSGPRTDRRPCPVPVGPGCARPGPSSAQPFLLQKVGGCCYCNGYYCHYCHYRCHDDPLSRATGYQPE